MCVINKTEDAAVAGVGRSNRTYTFVEFAGQERCFEGQNSVFVGQNFALEVQN